MKTLRPCFFRAARFRFFNECHFHFSHLVLRFNYAPLTLLSSLGRFPLFLVAAGFLLVVLIACAGGGGGGSSGGGNGPGNGGQGAFEVKLTFAPISGGFRIANRSGFGNFVSLNITATASGSRSVSEPNIDIAEFVDNSYYDFTVPADLDWKFQIIGILSGGGEREVDIDFVWDENEADHNDNGGIRSGANHDGDARADSEDTDDDNDGVNDDHPDECPKGVTNWESNAGNDNDGDGCRDSDEDEDDDNDNVLDSMDTGTVGGRECRLHEDCDDDGVNDGSDQCRTSVLSWTSTSSSDNDGDGCRDSDEDDDDDNDGLDDVDEPAGCELNSDCDNDGLDDGDEVAGCVQEPDCDRDGLGDNDPIEQMINSNNVTCSLLADCDSDGLEDGDEIAGCVLEADCDSDGTMDGEDIDADGDGLIEIANAAELNAVRYALNGRGRKLSADGSLDSTGCGGAGGSTSCAGYELVANISLASYANADNGKGWQPLGHDTGSAAGCQGTAFSGTFEGNGWTISNLSISRSGQDCVGLFGNVAANSEVRNLTLNAETVIGHHNTGGLVGVGESVRFHSCSVVVVEVRGGQRTGGLVGAGTRAEVYSSSVVAGEVSGNTFVGGLVGAGASARIVSSSVMAGEVSGRFQVVGGLVGEGSSVQIYSSSVVVGEVSDSVGSVGGLVGSGSLAQIYSSSVVVGEVNGNSGVGGLISDGFSAQIYSSSVVVGNLSGTSNVAALAGTLNSDSRVAYSYVVSPRRNKALVDAGEGKGAASYWYNATIDGGHDVHGVSKTSSELTSPPAYMGIYATWDDNPIMFDDGSTSDEPLAVWCDRDNSGSIETGEDINANLIWDFGTSSQYPAIRCTPLDPDDWRDWWSLEVMADNPEFNQDRLNQLLP